ncbi:hypothetical protein MtrunA17_Chr6g0468221 [Medicago truncatula]|uniref:Uncharacterized protein n=1 Tax=Medicago truncatula TaxID=3880 RepID=A0A396HFM9_MEDTR|nr:hypothetical protein MtrunA17_Chr6g0468221 [Medicago truncatula]
MNRSVHQRGILNALCNVDFFTNEQLGTETGKIINGETLKNMRLISKECYKKLSTNLKESDAVSAIMKDFPPICKQDPLDVQMHFIRNHFETTGIRLSLKDVPETMYGGALPVAKSRKTKRKTMSKDHYLEDSAEKSSKKSKKVKSASGVSNQDVAQLKFQNWLKGIA